MGVGLGEGRRRPRSAVGDEERKQETRWAQNRTEQTNGMLFDCLTTYTGMSYILRASRCPCGTYKVGRWLCAPSDLELGTQSSGLRVPLGSAEHGGRVAGDLRGTLDVDPNPNGILPLHRLRVPYAMFMLGLMVVMARMTILNGRNHFLLNTHFSVAFRGEAMQGITL